MFALWHALFIGFLGSSASFGPLLADISHWFERRRGLAVSIVACGNYLAGTLWPPVVQHLIETLGWRDTQIAIGAICLVTMLPLSLALRRRPPAVSSGGLATASTVQPPPTLGISPAALQVLLVVAGLACCVAMSMPQVHIVAYCGDLGYGPAAGARMLSLMLGFGIVSRLLSGWIADHIGGVRTLLLGSVLQGTALLLYVPFDGLASLYIVSALFGLFQGGIVPSYALIIREFFPPREAGARVGLVMMATLFGMALGGWMSGAGVRPHWLVSGGIPQRNRLEPAEPLDRCLAATASRSSARACLTRGLQRCRRDQGSGTAASPSAAGLVPAPPQTIRRPWTAGTRRSNSRRVLDPPHRRASRRPVHSRRRSL